MHESQWISHLYIKLWDTMNNNYIFFSSLKLTQYLSCDLQFCFSFYISNVLHHRKVPNYVILGLSPLWPPGCPRQE